MADAVRKVDIAHSGQTVAEAMEQLKVEVKSARRDRETVLLVVHGFGASGVGGAIKAALSTELPRLARQHGFRAYSYADKDRIPREQNVDARTKDPRCSYSAKPNPLRTRRKTSVLTSGTYGRKSGFVPVELLKGKSLARDNFPLP